ncbi:DNA internalization-related competence protein ComEC/Rec2 [Desulfacinum hydrothermale]|uniref:DNA internalization-related competence protein ComEC/Rec2 n=1 Tax=Desulfacinum hydrothermale TaxID=109258 RepID=UPI001FE4849D|nr:DNA internalization-related competence protein ComEC/Rec2 [Desulfacinum hydrothermale]
MPVALALAAGLVARHLGSAGMVWVAALAGAIPLLGRILAPILFRNHRPLPIFCGTHWILAALVLGASFGLGFLLQDRAKETSRFPQWLAPHLDGPEETVTAVVSGFPDFYPEKTVLPLSLLRLAPPLHSPRKKRGNRPTTAGKLPGAAEAIATGEHSPLPRSPGTDPCPQGVRVRLVVKHLESAWRVGDILKARLKLRSFHNFQNPGGFDYVAYQARQGFFARAFVKTDRLMERPSLKVSRSPIGTVVHTVASFPEMVFRWVDGLRQRSRGVILETLEGDGAAVGCALLLGYRHMIPARSLNRFRDAGVLHLLAISGLHVGIVAWVAFWVTRLGLRLLVPRLLETLPDVHAGWAAALAAAALYALLAGLALPTQRALCMLGLAVVAVWSFRRPDPVSLVAAAAVALLASDPWNLFRASFQLSFAAFLGIALLYPRLSGWMGRRWPHIRSGRAFWLRPFVDAFLLSAAATAAVWPLTAYHFHGLSLVGLAANTLVVPVMGCLVLPLGLVGLAVHPLWSVAGSALIRISGGVLQGALRAVDALAGLPFAYAHVGRMPAVLLAAYYGGALVLFSALTPKKKAAFLAALGLLAAAGWWVPHPITPSANSLRVTVLDVGQGSATLVQCGGDGAMLVDGGGFYDETFDVGRAVVAPALWALGVKKLDWVVLSHDQADHRNGLKFILKHFRVSRYLESGLAGNPTGQTQTAAICRKRKIPVVPIVENAPIFRAGPRETSPVTAAQDGPDGTGFPLGDCRVRILHPSRGYVERLWDGGDLNDVSVVLAVTYGKTGILIPGDISSRVEQHLLRRVPRDVRRWILVAPHHGSAHSTGGALLDALRPEAVLVSCGHLNPFHFPAKAFLQRCRTRSIPVLRTDRQGALFAESDGRRWLLRTFAPGRNPMQGSRAPPAKEVQTISHLPPFSFDFWGRSE